MACRVANARALTQVIQLWDVTADEWVALITGHYERARYGDMPLAEEDRASSQAA